MPGLDPALHRRTATAPGRSARVETPASPNPRVHGAPAPPPGRTGPPGSDAPAAARLHRNVAALGATTGWLNFAMQTWSPVLPLLLVRHGAPAFGVAAAYAVGSLGGAVSQYFGGTLADRFGGRLLISMPTFASGVLCILMAFSAPWQLMAASYVALQIVFGLQTPSWTTLIADSTPPAGRTAAFAVYNFLVSPGYVLGPLVGGLVIVPFVAPVLYIGLTGLSFLLMGAVRLRYLAEPRVDLGARSPARTSLSSMIATAQAAILGSPSRRRLLVVTTGSASVIALTISGPFLSLVAHLVDGLRPRQVDLLFAVGALGMVVSSLVAREVARRIGERATMALALVVNGAAVALYASRMGLVEGMILFVAMFGGYQLAYIVFSSLRATWAAGRDFGAAIGGSAAVAGVVVFAAVTAGGALGAAVGRGAPLVLAAALSLVTAALVLLPLPATAAEPV